MSMTVNSMASNELQKNFQLFNAASKLTPTKPAAADAAGLAIAEKLTAQINGYDKGSENTADMNNLVQTAEGALGSVTEQLQRLNELALQASNGIYNDDDRQMIQKEVDQILDQISDTVQNTTFNNKPLLDGSFADQNTSSGPNGTGMQVTIGNMSLEALGLAGLSVTDPNAINITLGSIALAINTVSQQRSDLGAISNTFQHTIASNDIASLNLAAARSGIADTDYAKQISEAKKEQALEEYRLRMQQAQMRQQERVTGLLMK